MVQEEELQDEGGYTPYQIGSTKVHKPLQVEVTINEQMVSMENDTGAAVTLVSEKTFHNNWTEPEMTLHPCTTGLCTFRRATTCSGESASPGEVS